MIAFFLGGWGGGGSSMRGFIEEKSPDFRFQEVGISGCDHKEHCRLANPSKHIFHNNISHFQFDGFS